MEGAFIGALLYPLGIAVFLVVRGVVFVLRLFTWPFRARRRRRKKQTDLQVQQYILDTAREQAWAIHQATHPTPLTRKPWEP